VYCGKVTAVVCGVHGPNEAGGCWVTLRRYRHRDGCRLGAHHSDCSAYAGNAGDTEEAEEEWGAPASGTGGMNQSRIRRIYERKGFDVWFTEEFVMLEMNGRQVAMPNELYVR
jgi:hypothetical protein